MCSCPEEKLAVEIWERERRTRAAQNQLNTLQTHSISPGPPECIWTQREKKLWSEIRRRKRRKCVTRWMNRQRRWKQIHRGSHDCRDGCFQLEMLLKQQLIVFSIKYYRGDAGWQLLHLALSGNYSQPPIMQYTLNKHRDRFPPKQAHDCVKRSFFVPSTLILTVLVLQQIFCHLMQDKCQRKGAERKREVYCPLLVIFRVGSGQGWNSVYWTATWWKCEERHFPCTSVSPARWTRKWHALIQISNRINVSEAGMCVRNWEW